MVRLLGLLLVPVTQFFRCRRDLMLENLALRQQLELLIRRRPQARFAPSDRLFWVLLRRAWKGWRCALILVEPDTVVRWHRAGFKSYWTWLSRHQIRAGRKCVSKDMRNLIFRLVAENRIWGAPRIHGELRMLGFNISERTVARWMRKAPKVIESAVRWKTFLNNNREAITAMDFFTVPTRTFGILYCFFVITQNVGLRISLKLASRNFNDLRQLIPHKLEVAYPKRLKFRRECTHKAEFSPYAE